MKLTKQIKKKEQIISYLVLRFSFCLQVLIRVYNCVTRFLKQSEAKRIEAMQIVHLLTIIEEGSSSVLAVLATIWNSGLNLSGKSYFILMGLYRLYSVRISVSLTNINRVDLLVHHNNHKFWSGFGFSITFFNIMDFHTIIHPTTPTLLNPNITPHNSNITMLNRLSSNSKPADWLT